jgi:hypothetical protein
MIKRIGPEDPRAREQRSVTLERNGFSQPLATTRVADNNIIVVNRYSQ